MKKLSFRTMPMLMVCTVFSLFCESCNSSSLVSPVDSVIMKSEVGDSIYRIITEAKKIKAEEIKLAADTTKAEKQNILNVNSKYVPLVLFAVSDPKNFGGNTVSFGSFIPCFKLTFVRKEETCTLNFDFGLKKWNICDNTGKDIKRYDLSSDNMLRIANMLFPENDLYKKLINIEKK